MSTSTRWRPHQSKRSSPATGGSASCRRICAGPNRSSATRRSAGCSTSTSRSRCCWWRCCIRFPTRTTRPGSSPAARCGRPGQLPGDLPRDVGEPAGGGRRGRPGVTAQRRPGDAAYPGAGGAAVRRLRAGGARRRLGAAVASGRPGRRRRPPGTVNHAGRRGAQAVTPAPHGLRNFAHAWARAVDGTSYVPMTRAEIDEFLFGLTERLAAALCAEPSGSTSDGYDIGAALVAADIDAPEGLGRTVGVIHDRLLSDLGLTGEGPRRRLSSLLETVIAGYCRAMNDRTLDEQEEIRCAALMAREQAERALRASEARFRHEAMHDPLTGLPNRALFAERLDQIFTDPRQMARLGVCFVDLDGFKAVNDSFGHHVAYPMP